MLDDAALRRLARCAVDLGLAALVEVHSAPELDAASDAGATIIGVNSRDLRTLAVDLGVCDALAADAPPGAIMVAESGIRSRGDINRLARAGYHAHLIGERLMGEPDPGAALAALLGRAPDSASSSPAGAC